MAESPAWETARGESMNYVEELKGQLKTYSYADANEASATHKEMCKFLQERLTKAAENFHLADDFLRGARSSDLERLLRGIKDDAEIVRDEVISSYIEWKYPKANIIREIISKDAQILRHMASIIRLSEQMREAAISTALPVLQQSAAEATEQLNKLSYTFSDRERLCR